MNESKSTAPDRIQRRRQLLRGVVSAPVVLTISSGAGATMNSNMKCVANQIENPQHGTRTIGVSTSTTSTVIRVPLYRATNGKLYIRGSDVVALGHTNRPVLWITSGEWWEFNATNNVRVGANAVTLSATPPLTNPVQYAVLQVNQLGQIVSAGTNPSTSTSMVHGTCWNSFRAGYVPPL